MVTVDRIRHLLKISGASNGQLAQALDLPSYRLSRWLNKKRPIPSQEVIERLWQMAQFFAKQVDSTHFSALFKLQSAWHDLDDLHSRSIGIYYFLLAGKDLSLSAHFLQRPWAISSYGKKARFASLYAFGQVLLRKSETSFIYLILDAADWQTIQEDSLGPSPLAQNDVSLLLSVHRLQELDQELENIIYCQPPKNKDVEDSMLVIPDQAYFVWSEHICELILDPQQVQLAHAFCQQCFQAVEGVLHDLC